MKRPDPSSSTPAAQRTRREECQPVLGERRRRPQLTAGPDGVAGTVAEAPQAGPIAPGTAVVDEAHEPVEVGAVDQPVEGVVVVRIRHQTSGHG